ncbi:hypothetical protein [Sphingomonas faeni]|uniref:hypothetical protein n=1 Tax=Sphingomonas faeni TaxID=185950 RepID=UPI00335E7D56
MTTSEAQYRKMMDTFRTLVSEGSLPETALAEVAAEQGVPLAKARRALQIVVGDLDKFAAKLGNKNAEN